MSCGPGGQIRGSSGGCRTIRGARLSPIRWSIDDRRFRRQIQGRLDQLLVEADRLRRALAIAARIIKRRVTSVQRQLQARCTVGKSDRRCCIRRWAAVRGYRRAVFRSATKGPGRQGSDDTSAGWVSLNWLWSATQGQVLPLTVSRFMEVLSIIRHESRSDVQSRARESDVDRTNGSGRLAIDVVDFACRPVGRPLVGMRVDGRGGVRLPSGAAGVVG